MPAMHALATRRCPRSADALGHELAGAPRSCVVELEHARDQDLVIRQRASRNTVHSCAWRGFAASNSNACGLALMTTGRRSLHRHVMVMRPFVVAPAHVHAHRDRPARSSARGSAPRRAVAARLRNSCTLAWRYIVCRPMPEIRRVDLQQEPRCDDRLVFGAQCLGDAPRDTHRRSGSSRSAETARSRPASRRSERHRRDELARPPRANNRYRPAAAPGP